MKPKEPAEEEDVTMEEEREPQKRSRRKTESEEPEPSEPQESPDTGGAFASRQPYQPIPRTDESTLQEMTNAPSRPLDTALLQDLVDWCGDIPFGHTKFLNIHRDCGEDAVMGPPQIMMRPE